MKVFVCSTSYDLLDVRAEVCELIKRLGYEAVAFEHPRFFAAAQDGARHDKCVSQAGKADALVAIIDQRYGAPYMGTEFYPGEKISMTWAEVRCALQNGVPVACFVRDKTWAERNMRSEKEGWADCRVFELLDELQDDQRSTTTAFKDSTDLKPKIARWLDQLAKRVSYSLIELFNAGFLTAYRIEALLRQIYEFHEGEIWLFNNDLELIKPGNLPSAARLNRSAFVAPRRGGTPANHPRAGSPGLSGRPQ